MCIRNSRLQLLKVNGFNYALKMLILQFRMFFFDSYKLVDFLTKKLKEKF